jgi:hypothetical protein
MPPNVSTAALLTSTSIRPNCSIVASVARTQLASFGDVEPHEARRVAELARERFAFHVEHVADHDARTFRDEQPARRRAHATRTARDDRYLSFQSTHVVLSSIPVCRLPATPLRGFAVP